MSWQTEIASIRQLLLNNWSTTEVAWRGEHFEPPNRTGDPTSPAIWVSAQVSHQPSLQMGFGSAGVREYPSELVLSIYVEPNVGDYLVRGYADTLGAIFRDQTTDDRIWFDEPWLFDVGIEGDWYRWDLNIPYRRLKSFGVADAPDLAGAVSDTQTVTQASHGFSVGDWIEWTGATWQKATADGNSDLNLVGVVSKVTDTSTFQVTTGGSVVITSHGWTLGPLWLHQSTAGTVTSSEPSSGRKKQVASATTANRVTVVQIVSIDV